MNIAVIGTGLMGGSFCKAFKKYTDLKVFGYDSDKKISNRLLETESADGILNDELLKESDIILICLNPCQTINYIKENCNKFKKNSLISDICGVKKTVVDEVSALLKKCGVNYIGCHPMAGKEMSGFDYSDSELFQGASMILIENENCEKKYFELMTDLAKKIGFKKVVKTDAEKHDKVIAYTSQLAHIVSNAYIRNKKYDIKGFSAGSYQDMTRVSIINGDMWSELMTDNSENLWKEIDGMISKLEELKDAVKNKDRKKLSRILKEGDILKREELN